MSNKSEQLRCEDRIFHVYNRGVDRKRIFFSQTDYEDFLRRMSRALSRVDISLLAYCLLPNHFHLVVHQRKAYAISQFMQQLCFGYVRTTNWIQGRTGHLFQGRFRMIPVEDSASLLRLSRYIHMNPVAAKLVEDPLDWQHSSFPEYVGTVRSQLLNLGPVLDAAGGREQYAEFVRGGPRDEE